jgi:chromosome segregation protein
VTGGAAVRESGALARERDLRELPDRIGALQQSLDALQTAFSETDRLLRTITDEQRALDTELVTLAATTHEHEQQRARLSAWLAEIERDGQRSDARATILDHSCAEADLQREALEGELGQLASERDGARSDLDAIAQQMGHAHDAVSPAEIALRDAQQQLATQEERLNAERRRESALTAQQTALHQERSLRAERAATVDGEITALETQASRLSAEISALEVAHESGTGALEPRAERLAAVLADLAVIEEVLEQARAGLIDAERQRGVSGVDVERIRGELGALRQRIMDELEIDEPNKLLYGIDSGDLQSEARDDAEQEITRLKDRLRRIGYAGENAVEDYERERERHTFLREQLADVQGAAVAIRQMLDEIRGTMQQRFEETFNRVSTVFSQMFSTLFGGGSARLVMVMGEDGDKTGGIDIVAQPPGKRLQSLALLSGGERALTGVALLFAILKVNPTPFCLLDEVDAALDEANVIRFRDQLTRLARETQAIIITHNRGTIEAAETLYGVSMKEDGTSTVLSLRLADVVLSD